MCSKKIEIIILGSASAISVDNRNHSCILVNADNENILLDCGLLLAQTMYNYKCVRKIGNIFISHMHTDHIGTLPLTVKQLQFINKDKEIRITGPLNFKNIMKKIFPVFFVENTKDYPDFSFHDLKEKNFITKNLCVHAQKNNHLNKEKYVKRNSKNKDILINSYSFLITYNNKKIVYSADIDNLNEINNICENADIVICDGTHIKNDKKTLQTFCLNNNIQKFALTHYNKKKFNNTNSLFYVNDGDRIII